MSGVLPVHSPGKHVSAAVSKALALQDGGAVSIIGCPGRPAVALP
jgi:hypothetical protein